MSIRNSLPYNRYSYYCCSLEFWSSISLSLSHQFSLLFRIRQREPSYMVLQLCKRHVFSLTITQACSLWLLLWRLFELFLKIWHGLLQRCSCSTLYSNFGSRHFLYSSYPKKEKAPFILVVATTSKSSYWVAIKEFLNWKWFCKDHRRRFMTVIWIIIKNHNFKRLLNQW